MGLNTIVQDDVQQTLSKIRELEALWRMSAEPIAFEAHPPDAKEEGTHVSPTEEASGSSGIKRRM